MDLENPNSVVDNAREELANGKYPGGENEKTVGAIQSEDLGGASSLGNDSITSSPDLLAAEIETSKDNLSSEVHESKMDQVSNKSFNAITTNPQESNFKQNANGGKGFFNFIYGKNVNNEVEAADEDNMNFTPSHKENGNGKENDILTGHNQDEEAGYKNLTFHGITSSLKESFSVKKSDSQTSVQSGVKLRPGLLLKKKLKNSQNLFLNSARLGKSNSDLYESGLEQPLLSDADLFRSALHEDLITMIMSGPPAALLFYSYFTFDHQNNRRAALLLGALNVHVNKIGIDQHIEHEDEARDSSKGFNIKQLQNQKFRIDLEYGMSETKMKWSIHKTYWQIAKLHSSLKFFTLNNNIHNVKNISFIAGKRGLKLPKFPRSTNKKNVKNFFVKTKNVAAEASTKMNQKRKNKLGKLKKNSTGYYSNKINNPSSLNVAENIDKQHGNEDYFENERDEDGENEDCDEDYDDNSVEDEYLENCESTAADNVSSIGSLTTTVPSLGSRVFNPTEHDLRQLQGIMGVAKNTSSASTNLLMNRKNSLFLPTKQEADVVCNSPNTQDNESENLNIRLEKYLKMLNIAVGLNPIANKIFHFYELSPLGVLLSYEKGYSGKQGYLIMLSSAKANGWRVSHFRFNDWKAMVQRHTKKWFLIRHSYITFVSDIHSTTPLDVFLVDDKFKCTYSEVEGVSAKSLNNLQITLENGEREMKLLCKSEKILKEWVSSINKMAKNTIWSKPNRFDSFAPVRQNCFAKLLVDGRDYFWALSEALLMARDCIFIHDWWLSPELYLRRPVEGNEAFRIDRILKKKAEEGVKIFIIVYRNVGSTVGTDSSWTKHSLLSLHNNIHVIRSPNQWLQNTYFWAHHEKLAMIDNMIAFIGGIDLCYGRYDTPEHVLTDESSNIFKQNFPGKDYSNARCNDFYELEKPFESMYDREVVPRMPWHDVHMMTVGEVARDLSRHFVQRWNYLLRQKRPSRPTPLLTPPSDLTEEEYTNLPYWDTIKDKSTCECQLLRSSGNWSLGLNETENSIQKAYLKLIETSQHYIYIENQFFVTSSTWDGVEVINFIGDAIVDRIIKAHEDNTNWKAYILIPLMPAFPSEVDKSDGSALRLIMLSQYMSISTGESSIYGKLKKLGIDAGDYIQFYSLRKWSEIGENNRLVTEQLYVHAKILIVDDRTCIIGSANINERSMLGNRDSEVAVIVRDTEFIKSKMDGNDYLAGRFAFDMRQRLMREHIGCDVDLVEFNDRKFINFMNVATKYYKNLHTLKPEGTKLSKKSMIISACKELATRDVLGIDSTEEWKSIHKNEIKGNGLPFVDAKKHKKSSSKLFESGDDFDELGGAKQSKLPSISNIFVHTFNNRAGVFNIGIKDNKPISNDPRVKKENSQMLNPDHYLTSKNMKEQKEFSKNVSVQLNNWLELNANTYRIFKDDKKNDVDLNELNDYSLGVLPSREDIISYLKAEPSEISDFDKVDMLKRVSYLQFLASKKKQLYTCSSSSSETNADVLSVNTTEYMDKLVSENYKVLDAELQQILAMVGVPEQLSSERKKKLFNLKKEGLSSEEYSQGLKQKLFVNSSFVDPYSFEDPLCDDFFQDLWFSIAIRNTLIFRLVFHCQPDSSVQTWSDYREFKDLQASFDDSQNEIESIINTEKEKHDGIENTKKDGASKEENMMNHRIRNLRMKLARGMIYGFDKKVYDKFTAFQMLNRIHGHLVLFPLKWLGKEIEINNWFYNADRIPPIDIYD